ncbi:amylo-alpha-1,6-glucosidase [Arenibacter sp. GZD96]|uniref:amylo-alpha-1,6-glucosidase n=1 Tax=Aurantibrevibacter litoralis TaxID=3106030 RepID=UPI002AFFAB27|nr:amylo-alpha-1,6-glucosidase [Arenibacter sp. GZD-96]MEA1787490.1 amylo-alpha-1,6-glucosidase [Arenibacter sp. GZD-96]
MIHFVNPNFDLLSDKEWIVTNGIGGYASGTLSGAHTRRYHGLLVASLNPPTHRVVLVSKVEETITVNQEVFELSSNQFEHAINPNGYQYLSSFDRFPLPTSIYQGADFKLSKTIFMVYGENTTVVEYKNTGEAALSLKIDVFLNHRDYHSNLRENEHTNFFTDTQEGFLKTYAYYGAHPLYLSHGGAFVSQPNWYKNYVYKKEQDRGLEDREDTFNIGHVEIHLKPGQVTHLIFSTDAAAMESNGSALKKTATDRCHSLRQTNDTFLNDLLVSGDQFIVTRKSTESHSIIAGYHWFTDWGRDSMIAMRGLCIDTGKQDVCKSILRTFLHYLDQGMLPNRFPDAPEDEVEYNTIDATLWLFVVLYEYYQAFEDEEFIKNAFDKLTDIIRFHKTGTRYNIHETPEGFIYGGEGIAQLTWMDARIGDYVVTPRHGCPVEIQALWYNALKTYQYFQLHLALNNEYIDAVTDSISKLEQHFVPFFFNDKGYLNDVVLPMTSVDDALRCNQIYTVSLPFSILNNHQQQQILEVVTTNLLTPFGLRTLASQHPDFKDTYGGDVWSRDLAYHQGTVWPFLLGEYAAAYLKIHGKTMKSNAHLESLIAPLKHHFYNANCIGGVSEVFDGLQPNHGKGTIHQAWSVSALIRIMFTIQKSQL